MFNFNYYSPTKVIFGRGTEDQIGTLAQEYGATKVLIHYGGGSVVRSGLLDRVKAALDAAGVAHVELGGVVPNPHLAKVREGIALGQREGVDFLLAVGGGSVIDSVKAISYGLAEPDKDVWELFEGQREAERFLPIASILTIAAAGSETSNSCVITNERTGEKRAYDDDISRPKFAIMNPELSMTLPDYQTQAGCTDIMMHTMERYFTQGGNMEITDALAEGLLRTVIKYAQVLHHDPENYEARAEIMWAGSLAHNGLTGCGNDGGDFASHMLEHELGGMFDVTHGAGLAAVWPSWARYVYRDCLPRFVRYATNVMGVAPGATDEETALRGIEAMEDFYHRIGMPINLRELGIQPTEEQILALAESCARATGGSQGSAKVLYQEDMAAIFRLAL
ncbi:MAG: iron-containing alcohol dehydrogenase [Oscillospiraceae bacterium]|nr:iron-containing alcohol dehydrogenase [Oscillospiraceae bacterium]